MKKPVVDVQHLDGDYNHRIDSGPIQFGDDWPGHFLRGDNAMSIAITLEYILVALEHTPSNLGSIRIEQLRRIIESFRSVNARDNEHRLVKPDKSHVFDIVVGDWSEDGHGKCDHITVKSNFPVDMWREVYLKRCEDTGIMFHDLDRNNNKTHLFTEFEQNHISKEELMKLMDSGISSEFMETWARETGNECMNTTYIHDPKDFVTLLIEFIRVGMPENAIAEIKNGSSNETFNGYWGSLNVQLGYGCY